MKHHATVQNVREWCNSHHEKIFKKLLRTIFKTAVVPFTHSLKRDMMLYIHIYVLYTDYIYTGADTVFCSGGRGTNPEAKWGTGEGGSVDSPTTLIFFL